MKRLFLIAVLGIAVIVVIWFVLSYLRDRSTIQAPATQIPPTVAAPTAVPPTKAPPTSPPQPTANPILNILWMWTRVTNQTTNETTSVPDPENYTITFNPDGTLEGKADCNTFTGTYSQMNGFSIKLGAMTKMACGDDSLDQQYLQLLGSVAAGGPDGQGNLALETAGGEQRMLFKNGGNVK
jgi:heat shock protein HslJ